MAELLDECGPHFASVRRDLAAARSQLREFARGIHPTVLTEAGPAAALAELAEQSSMPVTVNVPPGRWPPTVEAAVYFVCSEALTNVAKYAGASRVTIHVEEDRDQVRARVVDDGVGGADPSAGSGLRGLADRVEALDGRLRIDSPAGGGTRVTAEIPLR